jgi:hypothetical protein
MKKLVLFLVCIISVGPPVLASVSPIAGYYVSQELSDSGVVNDGIVLDGHWSEAYPTGQAGAVGSAVQAASWNNVSLGTMWEIEDLTLATVVPIGPLVDFGNGYTQQIYHTTYDGGTLTLKDTGPWWNVADSGTEYALTVDSYVHTTTKLFFNGAEEDFTTSIALTATFDDNPNASISFLIAAAVPTGFGQTPAAGYPDFAITAPGGAWGNVQKIRMEIIPEPATMALLALGGLLLRKRK